MSNTIIKSNYTSMIHDIRGYKVILDHDLALFYGIETKRLKEQVRRNITRFPEDFMFEISSDELPNLRSQIATSSSSWGGRRYSPMAFTEQGVAMLSSVINSEKAIQVNIEIMRAFSHYRALLLTDDEMNTKIELLDDKINKVFKLLLDKIDALHQPKGEKRVSVGYKIPKKNN